MSGVSVADRRRRPFVQVDKPDLAAIREIADKRMVPYVRSVYLAIAEIANDQRSPDATVSRAEVACRAGVSAATVKRCTPLLVEAGVIEIIERPGLAHVWALVSSPGSGLAAGGCRVHETGVSGLVEGGSRDSFKEEEKKQELGATHLSDVDVVWQHWQEVFSSPRSKLDATRRRIIEAALKIRPVEECCLAIDGLARSEYNVKGGYTDVKYALRGGGSSPVPDATITRMIAFANGGVRVGPRRSDELPSGHNQASPEWEAQADAYAEQMVERQKLETELSQVRSFRAARKLTSEELAEIFDMPFERLREEVSACRQ